MFGLRFSHIETADDYSAFPAFHADPRRRLWNLWSYLDSRDAAQAIRLAVESDAVGADVFIIAANETVMITETPVLIAEALPSVPVRRALGPHESLLSSAKARGMLGFIPVHSWRASDRG